MYKIGDKLLVLEGSKYGYKDRIGQVGRVIKVDDVSVNLEFTTSGGIYKYNDGWFIFSDVTPAVDSLGDELTIEKAVDFLISQGYTVTLTKS